MLPYLKVFLISMTPIGEARAGIIWGLSIAHLNFWKVFLSAILGNIFVVIILLFVLRKISLLLEKKNRLLNLWNKILLFSYRRHKEKFRLLGSIALVVLVAIPLPFTGAWTGSLAAFVFKVSYWRSLFLITLGIIIASFIVSLSTYGVLNF